MNIQQEIKQNKPFQNPSEEAAVSLLRTADLVRRALAVVVEPHGITVQQYNVLRILRGAGTKGLPTLEIADRMIEETPGITRLIDRLEAKQLVSRERCATDRRQVFCRITKQGLTLLGRLDRPIVDADAWSLSGLSRRELTHLIELLDRARNGLHAEIDIRRKQTIRRITR